MKSALDHFISHNIDITVISAILPVISATYCTWCGRCSAAVRTHIKSRAGGVAGRGEDEAAVA